MSEFDRVAKWVTEVYDVEFDLTPDDDMDIYFRCPECDEPLLKEDWDNDEDLARGFCPVCGYNF